MQTTLKFKSQSISNMLMKVCWVIVSVMIVGTIVIKLATKNSYSHVQPLLLAGTFWFATCVFLGVIASSYHNLKVRDYQLAEINQNQTGIWITRYFFQPERVYVPFDWLKVVKNNGNIRLDWQRALRFDQKKRPRLQSHSGIALNSQWFDATELQNFLTTVDYFKNGAVGVPPTMAKSSRPKPKHKERKGNFRLQIIAMGAVLFVGNAVAFGAVGATSKKSHVAGNDSHQKVQLKDNTTYRSRDLKFTIHHSYAAVTDEGDPVLIVNMSVQPRHSDASLSADAFQVYRKWSDKTEADSDDYSEARDYIGTKIKIGGANKPVMNIMDTNGWYGDEYSQGVRKPFNIVIKRPKTANFDFLYQGFYYQYNVPGKDDDTSIVFHVKTKDLEVLK